MGMCGLYFLDNFVDIAELCLTIIQPVQALVRGTKERTVHLLALVFHPLSSPPKGRLLEPMRA